MRTDITLVRAAWVLGLVALCLSRAWAQVPVSGRWQEFAYTRKAVELQGDIEYHQILTELSRRGQLDDDVEIVARVQSISAGLIKQAMVLKPSATLWHWETHVTSSSDQRATCIAGGRLLFGSAFIRHLELTDEELATLIAHEVAHAIAEHQREELSEVSFLNPASIPISVETAMARLDTNWSLQIRLSRLARMQESEADQLGMTLAHMAGWSTTGMVRFYRKLAAPEEGSLLTRDYPSAASRLAMAETFARLFPQASGSPPLATQ